jgi:hypothetical protein
MALMLDIPLQTQETLMKYIGGLPAHIRNTVFMFGPTNLDEVSVQATYIEAGKAGVSGESSSSRKEDKRKMHGKNENAVTRKEGNPSCKHCKKEGHDEDICWQLHPEKRPKWFKEKKGMEIVATTTKPTDLGSDSSDESKISLVGMTGTIGEGIDCRSNLFHIRVIMRHTNIDTLIDSGSQSNLISEELVKQLGLKTQLHHKPYTLKWKINHKLLQDKIISCKYYKYISSFAIIFLMLSLVMLSTWMIVASVRCNRVQMANNILSVVMIVL